MHNSHVADAASTAMIDRGETTVADLLRRAGARQAFSLDLLTHSGTLMAAPAWERPGHVFRIAPAARNSIAGLLRRSRESRLFLMLGNVDVPAALAKWGPQRGIEAVPRCRRCWSAYSRSPLAT